MAILQVNFNSTTLHRKVPLQVILPVDSKTNTGGPYKTLYLLHGLFDNYTGWISNTRIERWAMERNLAVVMPSAENSFYIEMPFGSSCFGDFGEYVGKELVDVTRKMFDLSHKREDTFIAGLSMGGFGALRNGLKYNDTFGYIASLSAAIHIFEYPLDAPGRNIIGEDAAFGDLRIAVKTDKNPRVLASELKQKFDQDITTPLPKIYMACGTEDYLLKANQSFYQFMKQNNFDVVYEEGAGGHDWMYWDANILKVLEWLPLKKS